ncbi:hypothetical protein CXF68_04820 [Tenacibaculum sp. Bg11-29]|uniref:energy transducer TonB n=1 Tax=Tenacibaculum sp. Bg11-29 TaxID=2058306 RepID=UPI000C31CE5A|nr:energy transducer TonB [Tenacibaculum sp. Bg11-29]PKH50070.1 hypothetical protein CXF68_04820 [Tenacibaculum sp. Bg11-29]
MKNLLLVLLLLSSFFAYSQEEIEEVEIEIEEVEIESEEVISDVPFALIEEAPIHPNCDGLSTNNERKKCFNSMITKHVQKHFDIDLVKCLEKEIVINKKTGKKEEQCTSGDLSSGRKRLYVVFKIGRDGIVESINTRAPHPKLKEEAIRIVKLLPKMKPGKHRGIPVKVGYTLPITFNVE